MVMELNPDEIQDYQDTSIGVLLGIPFEEADKSTVEWIKWLHALDQPGLPGWPLLTSNVQLQKCSRCPRQFCSNMNRKRHFFGVHKLKLHDKDSVNTRKSLGEYLDGLSDEEAKRVLSFEKSKLRFIPGSRLLEMVSNLIWKSAFPPFSRAYLRAGFALVEILQGWRFPISSKELFSILDDASENTFLFGEAISMQEYIFGTTILSAFTRENLIASTSFLLEMRLVEAKLAHDKVIAEAKLAREKETAEAIQESLIKEEEAAQKRKANNAEKNKKKKDKRKEKNAKKQTEVKKVAPPTEATSSLAPADRGSIPDEVLSAPEDSSGILSDTAPPTEISSSLPLVNRDAIPPEVGTSPAKERGSLVLSESSMSHEDVSSPAETSSSLVPPVSVSMPHEDLSYLSNWDSEPAEDLESGWNVVRGRQKEPARSQSRISKGSQAGQKYHPSKSGGHFPKNDVDVGFRSQTRSNKGDTGHSEDLERRMVQGCGAWHNGRGRQQAPARSQSGISRGFHGDQNYPPLKFGAMNKNATITERTAPLCSRGVRELEPQTANDEEKLKTKADAEATKQPNQKKAKQQKPKKDKESLKTKADAATEQPRREKARKQKPANDEESSKTRTDAAIEQPNQQKGNIIHFGKMAFSMPVAVDSSDHHEADKDAEAQDSSLDSDQTSCISSGISHSYSHQFDKELPKVTKLDINARRFDGMAPDSPAALANQGSITQLSEQISILNERMAEFTSRVEELNSKISVRSQQNLTKQAEAYNSSDPASLFMTTNRFPFDIKLAKDFLAERWRAALKGEHEVYDPSSYSEAPSSSAAGVESSESPKGENPDNAADYTVSRDSETFLNKEEVHNYSKIH